MPIYLSVFKVEVSITKETSLFKFNCASALGTDVKKKTQNQSIKHILAKLRLLKRVQVLKGFFQKQQVFLSELL